MKILVTGFEPFGEYSLNPSQTLIQALTNTPFEGLNLVKTILPVDNFKGPELLLTQFRQHRPDAVLCFGLAFGRAGISLEQVALNLLDFEIPDNQGDLINDKLIAPDGPAAYFTSLPIRSMLSALIASGIPAGISLTAGAYLCNLVFYTIMHEIAQSKQIIPAGFVHLPALPEQAAHAKKPVPSMNIDIMLNSAIIMIQQIAENPSSLS